MNTLADLMHTKAEFLTLPAPVVRNATPEDARKTYNLASLNDLTTAHMTADQKRRYDGLLVNVRKWRQDARSNSGISFFLSSKQVGVGKTHIAKAVNASFCSFVGDMKYIDDVPQFRVTYSSRLYTARTLINMLGGDEQKSMWEIVPRHVKCLVIDDLGREGYLDYVKAEKQEDERYARYFHLINHLYERRHGQHPVNIFITTNLTTKKSKELLGVANWSRLLQMCPKGYILELDGIDDYRAVSRGRA